MTAPFHATAADRIKGTEARLGRKIWSSRELPDPMAKALWWKKRRWFFADQLERLGDGDGNHASWCHAFDEFTEAESAHDLLIRELWAKRFRDREVRAWAALASRPYLTATNRERA